MPAGTLPFLTQGGAAAGQLLVGLLKPVRDLQLSRWTISGIAGAGGTFQLEVDGAATGDVLTLAPDAGLAYAEAALTQLVFAGSTLRVCCATTGDPAPNNVAVRVSYNFLPTGGGGGTPGSLTVDYVDGASRVTLYTYAAGRFTPVDADLLTGRASIAQDGGVIVAPGIVWAHCGPGELLAAAFVQGVCSVSPRFEFKSGARLLGSVCAAGVYGPAFTATSSPLTAGTGFGFAYAGTTEAVLMTGGWLAHGFDVAEP